MKKTYCLCATACLRTKTCATACLQAVRIEILNKTNACKHGADGHQAKPDRLVVAHAQFAILSLAIILAAAPAALAQQQQRAPNIGYVYPAGGRQGDTFQVAIGGQFFMGADKVYVSGTGVQTKVLQYEKPLTPKEVNDLRDKIQELQKKPKDPEIIKEMMEIRNKLAAFMAKRNNPVLAETVTVEITMDSGAEPGKRELRLAAAGGLSNPLVFCVGKLTEISKKPSQPNVDPMNARQPRADSQSAKPEPEMNVTLPATVNGQIMPGGVDRYRFHARKGQRLVVVVDARELIPYLADAVPGWFQAAAGLYDDQDNELAFADHYSFHPDPVLYCKIPKDGQYVLKIWDVVYRGREDFVYRITLGELPFITSVFPLGGPADSKTAVELKGWNLPVQKLTMETKDADPDIIPLSVRKGPMISNKLPFAVDQLPESLEQEPNNQPQSAQRIALPMIINGRIDQPGDSDVFRFEGRTGQKIVAEVDARKLDSPLDSVLKLTDANGRQLALNDDYGDKGTGLSTHHADSLLMATLLNDGDYYLYLSDAQRKGGTEYAYRLRISEPRPDFALCIVPPSINIRAGTSVSVTVYALRKDGFSGEIFLALKDAPKGFALSGARLPAGQDQVRLTLAAPQVPLDEPVDLRIEGRALIDGRQILRTAVPAQDMMQAFIYRHLVPAKDLMVAVTGRARPPMKFLGAGPVRLPAGGTAPIRFSLFGGPLLDEVQLTLNNPPEGISIQKVSPAKQEITLLLLADEEKVKPGQKGNLIIDAFVERTPNPGQGKPQTNKRRIPLGTLPAIPFEIVEKD